MIKGLQTTFNAPIGAALMTDLYAGAAFCVIYQLNDPGPSDPDPYTYGIRRADGTWKPVADTFKEGT